MSRPALAMVHGLGGSSDEWEALRRRLPGWEVTARDLPGHGREAETPALGVDMETATRALVDWVNSCLAPPVMVGHSLGGYLALRAVVVHGARARGLVLISARPGFASEAGVARWNSGLDWWVNHAGLDDAVVQGLARMSDTAVYEGLGSIDIPVLTVVGGQDRTSYRNGANAIVRDVPQSALFTVADARHSPHLTHPEHVAAAIDDFVASLQDPDTLPPARCATARS